MTIGRKLAIVAVVLFLLPAACAKNEPGPDLIFYNGVIVTMDASTNDATAIAIAGDAIDMVGGDEDILKLKGSRTEVIDLGGRTVMPGFVDPHTHILNDAGSQDAALSAAQDLAFAHGITAIGDLYVDEDFLRTIRLFDESGELHLRTSLYLAATTPCGEMLGDWYKHYPPDGDPRKILRVVGVKLFADGGACGLPAYSQPAPDIGNLWFTQAQMNAAVADAQSLGYQAAIHAIGDRGLEQAQTAIAVALGGGPNTLRHRIEHNQVIRPDQLPRYAEIGIIPVISSGLLRLRAVLRRWGVRRPRTHVLARPVSEFARHRSGARCLAQRLPLYAERSAPPHL